VRIRKWIIGAVAATFLVGSMTPEPVAAGALDGVLGLAAGVMIGSALNQGRPQPVYRNRTYQPRRAYRAARARPTARSATIQQKALPTKVQTASDPFASSAKFH
jgi:hypothetical protein